MKKTLAFLAVGLMLSLTPAVAQGANKLPNNTHWGAEPYYGSGTRTVWFVDASGRADYETYTQEWVAAMNAMYQTNHSLPSFLWYRASDIGWPSGINACFRSAQVLTICPNTVENPGQPGNYNYLKYDVGAQHFTEVGAAARIHPNITGSALRGSIWHELGHGIGLDHQPYGPMGCACVAGYTSHDFTMLTQLYGGHPD